MLQKSSNSRQIALFNQMLVFNNGEGQCVNLGNRLPIKWTILDGRLYSVNIENEDYILDESSLISLKESLRLISVFSGYRQFYRKVNTVFQGRNSKVQIVVNKLNNSLNVCKILKRKLISQSAILHEISTLQKLNHPNIVEFREAYKGNNNYYIVTEMLERTLHIQIDQEDTKSILQQILKGLQYLHRHNIVHRDIKPNNIMLNSQGIVKIIDFGLSSDILNEDIANISCGTPGYIAPELLDDSNGHLKFPDKCDIFSVGVIMYEMYTQQQYYPGVNSVEILKCNQEPRNFELPDIPNSGTSLLKGLLNPNPYYRLTCDQALAHKYFYEDYDEEQHSISTPTMDVKLMSKTIQKYSWEYQSNDKFSKSHRSIKTKAEDSIRNIQC